MSQSQTVTPAAGIPAHVPAHLVKTFDFRTGLRDRPQEAIAELLDGEPIFYSPVRHILAAEGGAWVVTRAALAREIMSNPEVFSSAAQGEFMKVMGEDIVVGPLASDPPDHQRFRSLINPLFTPQKMFALAPKIQSWCDELIDRFIDNKKCEINAEFADHFPTGIFIDLMGFPRSELPKFVGWTQQFIHGEGPEQRIGGIKAISNYFAEVYDHPELQLPDTVTHYLLGAEIGGQRLTRGEFIGCAFVLFTAGLDTVVSSLGFVFRALAENQDLQAKLRANPEELPRHLEEMLRLFSPVTVQRIALADTELNGVTIRKGDRLEISLACASRDGETFADPAAFDATRNPNPHFAFGYGIHRCAGAQLARRDLVIALEQWFKRVPQFRLAPETHIVASGGPVLALDGLWIEWD